MLHKINSKLTNSFLYVILITQGCTSSRHKENTTTLTLKQNIVSSKGHQGVEQS